MWHAKMTEVIQFQLYHNMLELEKKNFQCKSSLMLKEGNLNKKIKKLNSIWTKQHVRPLKSMLSSLSSNKILVRATWFVLIHEKGTSSEVRKIMHIWFVPAQITRKFFSHISCFNLLLVNNLHDICYSPYQFTLLQSYVCFENELRYAISNDFL